MALSRKNSLFAGSDEGGENWACLASLVETCKLNGVNLEAYINDVLTPIGERLAGESSRRTPTLGIGAPEPH
jgi:transposase